MGARPINIMGFYRQIIIILFIFKIINSSGQVITTVPVFPTINDTVTIFYHTDRGNGNLDWVMPIYAHTGVISSNSISDENWQHVVGNEAYPDRGPELTWVSPNIHKLVIPIKEFYGIKEGEDVKKLAFVFRNNDGSLVGRNADGSDFYIDLYTDKASVAITSPSKTLMNPTDAFILKAQSSVLADLTLYIDNELIAEAYKTKDVEIAVNVAKYSPGSHLIKVKADFSDKIQYDSTYFTSISDPEILPIPEGVKEGININPDHSDHATFNLYAPGKKQIYLLGDFNNWQVHSKYLLHNDISGNYHWIEVSGLNPEVVYTYQYFIPEDNLRLADPFNPKRLNPDNSGETISGSKPYPSGKTAGVVSVFQTKQVGSISIQATPQHYRLSGSIEGIDNVDVYLFRAYKMEREDLNKTRLVNGKFEMEGSIVNPEILSIKIGEHPLKRFSFFLSGDDITIKADYDSLRNAKISGAPYQKEIDHFNETVSFVAEGLMKEVDAGRFDMKDYFNKIVPQSIIKFVEENPESPAIPYYVRVLNEGFELEDLLQLYALIDKSSNNLNTMDTYNHLPLNDSPTLQILRKRISELDQVAVGKKYTDFTMPDTLGNRISISDYDGKYRLVDFWASWCKPCRAEFPEMKKLYQKYRGNNFTVIGISFDDDLSSWKRAIVKDQLEWIQMSAPKSWNSEAGKFYVFGGIPANVLIGPDGTILARNVHGEALKVKLKEIFGF